MSGQLKPPVNGADHTRGAKTAQLEIVEFGDFQCPYCGAEEPIVEEIMEQFGEAISFTFRNFPLRDAHEYAFDAALAAEAAAKQGKYWEMHDLIYANQDVLNQPNLILFAEQLGLDIDVFQSDIKQPELSQKVEDDFESGARSGVNGTPSFFVNGTRFDGGAADLYGLIKESISSV